MGHRKKGRGHVLLILLGVAVLLLAGCFGFYRYLAAGMPSLEQLENYNPKLSTRILDRNGVVIKELYTQRRLYVPLSEMSPFMAKAVLAIEDHKFYRHWGIRPDALAAVLIKDVVLLHFHPRGASTITQQLARTLYFSRERTIARKLREQLTAIEIERHYSKDEILEMYLTQSYFGHGAYGVEAAARTFFSCSASELTLPQAALIAGLPRSPSGYDPLRYPERALERRNIVLRRMWELKYISKEQYEEARNSDLGLVVREIEEEGEGIAPYFTENVRQILVHRVEALGMDPYHDGLTVETTLDSRLQACAEKAVNEWMPVLQEQVNKTYRRSEVYTLLRRLYPKATSAQLRGLARDKALVDSLLSAELEVQVAFVAIDPATGGILAMIGGRDFERTKFNRATQAVRQPGSAFKPILYTTLLEKGLPISTHVPNEEVVVKLPNGDIWAPKNFDDSSGGDVTLREALARSLNLASIRLIRDYTTPQDVAAMGHRLGISTHIDPVDALALGTSGVIPLELVSAYGVFQAHGVRAQPMYITRVLDEFGQVAAEYVPQRSVVMSEQTAFLITSLLESVTQEGTGVGLRSTFHFYQTAAGKTGTTDNFTDAWFVGFTPHLAAGVWVGFDNPAKTLGPGQEGAHAALPIWARFIALAYDTMKYEDRPFTMPDGIVTAQVCAESGKLAREGCPHTYTEYFDRRYPLEEYCPLHIGSFGLHRRWPSIL
jgi:penicillin-binding protein 1A